MSTKYRFKGQNHRVREKDGKLRSLQVGEVVDLTPQQVARIGDKFDAVEVVEAPKPPVPPVTK